MKLTLPVALTAAAVLAVAAAPSFACPCAEGASGASTKASAPKATVQAVALKKPVKANAQTAEYPSISQAALTKAIAEKKVTVIDVNGTEKYKSGRIPTALNYEAISGNLKSKLPANKGALIVAYCGNEHCGAYKKAAAAAKSLGYTNVSHFSPGIAGWVKSGAAVEKG